MTTPEQTEPRSDKTISIGFSPGGTLCPPTMARTGAVVISIAPKASMARWAIMMPGRKGFRSIKSEDLFLKTIFLFHSSEILQMMSMQLIAEPLVEPVTLDEAKLFLRIDTLDDDALLANLIMASRRVIELTTRTCLLQQTWRFGVDRWPSNT